MDGEDKMEILNRQLEEKNEVDVKMNIFSILKFIS